MHIYSHMVCAIELWTHQKFESFKKKIRDEENRIQIYELIPKTTEIVRIYFGAHGIALYSNNVFN